MASKIQKIPTNIITGFLGVGKTSAILHLLKNKPENERWAVLVNEFGEIGIDGSLLKGQYSENSGVFIREVPGGCMCCAGGLPMQVALNQLLTKAKPDRLLIEPTGLGHPVEVLQILSDKFYQQILQVEKILTLVDARNLTDRRYTEHDTFNQQISIADIVVGNKQDLYQGGEPALLESYVKNIVDSNITISFTEQGRIDPQWLQGETAAIARYAHHHHSSSNEVDLNTLDLNPLDLNSMDIPAAGYIKAENEGEGFSSIGWRFDSNKVFNRKKLHVFLTGLNAERMKAVFITEQGIFGYNLTRDALTEIELDETLESRLEIIAYQRETQWQDDLLACVD
ncbi:MAG: GTP-binding protein [Oleispira sp.]|nr:GTP-binding protein [Oleispira sp.]MBL4880564.1 GTP-binding protein [Oleispira sp.]